MSSTVRPRSVSGSGMPNRAAAVPARDRRVATARSALPRMDGRRDGRIRKKASFRPAVRSSNGRGRPLPRVGPKPGRVLPCRAVQPPTGAPSQRAFLANPRRAHPSMAAAAEFVLPEAEHHPKKTGLARWLTTTDHKEIGILYLWTGFLFFILGGLAALMIRMELWLPGATITDGATFNEFFSLHGTTMVFLWIMPALAGLGNYFVPIMIKAKDMAFPRVNALSFWLIPPAGLLLYLPMVMKGVTLVNVTWVGYPPLSTNFGVGTIAGLGLDMWLFALILLGMASTLGSVNFLVTIFKMRAPGVTLHKMPLFCWAQLAT